MSDCGQTPSQLLMGRRLRSLLPATKESRRPSTVNSEETRARFVEKQRRQKKFDDRNASTRAASLPFHSDATVLIQSFVLRSIKMLGMGRRTRGQLADYLTPSKATDYAQCFDVPPEHNICTWIIVDWKLKLIYFVAQVFDLYMLRKS